jgi:NADH-quinone oxidoreductase subunit C
MVFEEINNILTNAFPESVVETIHAGLQPAVVIKKEDLWKVCEFIYTDNRLYFDFLSCVTALDNGPDKGTMEIIYHLSSIPFGHNLMLKTVFKRNQDAEPLPEVPSVSQIWRTAEWHEREAYDLLGIHFVGNQDLRRILLPEDWEGHPLRKDYQAQERYHGIFVKYEDGERKPESLI